MCVAAALRPPAPARTRRRSDAALHPSAQQYRRRSDAVQHLDAQQLEAGAHGEGGGLAQQEARVLLRAAHHLALGVELVESGCGTREGSGQYSWRDG